MCVCVHTHTHTPHTHTGILLLLLFLHARVGFQGFLCGSFEDCLLARARLDLQQALQVNSEKSVPSYFYCIERQ